MSDRLFTDCCYGTDQQHGPNQPCPQSYDWHTEPCDCDDGKTYACDSHGYFEGVCNFCDGEGEVTASCCECDRTVPLNADGICEKCKDAADLPLPEFVAKYCPHIYLRDAA